MDGILLFSARNDHDLYDCASKRRTGEFSLICGYFLFVDRKIGYRLKDLRMKCNSLIKDYVSVSIAHELSCHMKLRFCMYAGIHRKQFCMALNSYKF